MGSHLYSKFRLDIVMLVQWYWIKTINNIGKLKKKNYETCDSIIWVLVLAYQFYFFYYESIFLILVNYFSFSSTLDFLFWILFHLNIISSLIFYYFSHTLQNTYFSLLQLPRYKNMVFLFFSSISCMWFKFGASFPTIYLSKLCWTLTKLLAFCYIRPSHSPMYHICLQNKYFEYYKKKNHI